MLVEGGKVVNRVTSSQAIMPERHTVDLKGRTICPSFIDNHCHILPTGLDLQKLNLSTCQSNSDVLDALRSRISSVEPGKWLHAVHYDQTKFGGEYLTRSELDTLSTSTPILLRHVNGHASVANSSALMASEISEDQPDPEGGSFRRDASGRIDGVLFERAHEEVTRREPMPNLEEMVSAILLAAEKMAEFGICSAHDMMTGRFDLEMELEAYRIAADRGCPVWTRLYLQWGEIFRKDGQFKNPKFSRYLDEGDHRCRIAGIKVFADGAIGSATAAIYGSYTGAPATGYRISASSRTAASAVADKEVSGQLIYAPDRLNQMVRIADAAGFQVSIHSIGDYATDLVLDAFSQVDDPARHRIEHAMILSDAQIDRLAKVGCFCCMQPEFLVRFGNSYRAQLGPEKASNLNRYRSVIDSGVPVSFSSDRPIVSGDPRVGIATAVNRPEGFDPAENITFEEAIDAYTTSAAAVSSDSDLLGGLEPGQAAQWQFLD